MFQKSNKTQRSQNPVTTAQVHLTSKGILQQQYS